MWSHVLASRPRLLELLTGMGPPDEAAPDRATAALACRPSPRERPVTTLALVRAFDDELSCHLERLCALRIERFAGFRTIICLRLLRALPLRDAEALGLRRSKSLEVLIPILYLKGVSTGDFEEALIALLGKDAGGLSATTVGRLKDSWSQEHVRWSKRDLSSKRYVYFWADGIHVQARLEDAAQCLLVIIGATAEGKKELVGLIDGVRESAQSWKELLLDLKRRRLAVAPELAVTDGALGFWQAIDEVWP